jgi:pyruvate formate lyase activating enzyme
MKQMNTPKERLADTLDRYTVQGQLWRPEGDRLRCFACGHRCLIAQGRRGICKVRFNKDGRLQVPFGYVAGLQSDPVEKKPFFHVLPGSNALTFGMMGCDFHCSYCQNWVTSQALRDDASLAPIQPVAAAQLVRAGIEADARLVVSSYNEPLITAEWAVEVFKLAREAGLLCAFVSNGNLTPEVLDFLRPWLSAYKIDLKGFDDRKYRTLGGILDRVVEGIRTVHASGIWLEVVTLIVPGFNDSEAELKEMAAFLASVSRDIPWHVTAFHQDYKMHDPNATTAAQLIRASEIGREAGLRYVYAGNAPGRVGPNEDTLCPGCGKTLIGRQGYRIRGYAMTPEGKCPNCDTKIPGIWPENRASQTFSTEGARLPRPVRI